VSLSTSEVESIHDHLTAGLERARLLASASSPSVPRFVSPVFEVEASAQMVVLLARLVEVVEGLREDHAASTKATAKQLDELFRLLAGR
jgi:hypothetical protein